jgi:hypothetical protein
MEITLEEWDKTYKPIQNPFDPHASFDGVMFETYGKELEFVKAQRDAFIWTYIDGEDGTYIIEGFHFVNRIGYFVTAVPCPEGEFVSVIVSQNKHLMDMTHEELLEVPCSECFEYNIWEYACPTNLQDNEALCVLCCFCPEHMEERNVSISLDSNSENH